MRGRELQLAVDDLVLGIGGYWRPLSALARLLEEVGELAVALEGGDRDAVLWELADVVVVSTTVANQYCADLDEHRAPARPVAGTVTSASASASVAALTAAAGMVARILNDYEGDKRVKAGEVLPTLGAAVARLHGEVAAVAAALALPLAGAVHDALTRSAARDAARFERRCDPIHAPAVLRWAAANGDAAPTFLDRRAWGGPAWVDQRSLDWNLARQAVPLAPFLRARGRERVRAYVVELPADGDIDPVVATRGMAAELGGELLDGTVVPAWRFGGRSRPVVGEASIRPTGHGTFVVWAPS